MDFTVPYASSRMSSCPGSEDHVTEPPGVATYEGARTEGFEPDVIVVGGGSAGAAAARRLVDRDVRVLLLEAGGPDANPAIHDPGRLHELWLSEEDWAYETVPQAHASDRRLAWPRGRVLGGSSCLNAMIWVRGARADYETWAYLGAEGWGWDDVLPVFERIERRAAGDAGIVNILTGYEADPIHQAIVAAAQECGIPFNADYNGATQDGVSYMQYSIENGIRHSTAAAYLRPIVGHPNLRVELRARASGSCSRARGASGWSRTRRQGRAQARVRGHPVRRNDRLGAAAAALGRRAGRRAARARDRGRGRPAGRGAEPPRPPALAGHLHAEREVGPPSPGLPACQTHLFWRSQAGLVVPDIQPIHFMVPMYEPWMEGPENGFTLMGGMVRPLSRGTIRLSGPTIDDPPLIDPNVLACEADLKTLLLRSSSAAGSEPRTPFEAPGVRSSGIRDRTSPPRKRIPSLRPGHGDHVSPPGGHLQDGP